MMTTPADAATTADWLPGAVMAAGVLAVTVVMLRVWVRKRRATNERAASNPRDRIDALALSRQRDSIESLMADMQDTSRTCAAQVENRAARLEALLRQTDAKIEQLRSALEESDQTIRTRAASPAPPQTPKTQYGPDRGGLRLETERDVRVARVLRMHESGLTASEIAKQLGEEVGRVQLMLSLNGVGVEPHARASG